MATRYEYEYGMGEPTMGLPPTIADYMGQRRQLEDFQYAQAMQQQNQARASLQKQYDMELKLDDDLKRQRLGLGGLDAALADPYSNLHQTEYDSGQVDREGNPMYMTPQEMGIPEVQIEMGPVGEGPMKPLGLSPLNRMSGRRVVRDEFADAKAALRPKDAVSSNRMTTQEYIDRLKAKQVADGETDDRRTQNDLMLKLTDAELESIMAGANIKAKDIAADKPGVAEELQKAVTAYVQSKGNRQKLDLGGGAADGTATAPTETPTVSVSAKTVKTIKEGKYVQNEDGSIDFIYNDGRKVPYKK